MVVVSGIGFADQTIDPDIPTETTATFCRKDIYIDGVLVNNWQLESPVVEIDGVYYFPVDNETVSLLTKEGVACNLEDQTVVRGYHFDVDGIETSLNEVAIGENATYYSEELLEKLGYADIAYDHLTGIYISTDPSIEASQYAAANPNKAYIKGRVAYMMKHNWDITEDEAIEYEYLFRHEAGARDLLEEDLLIVVCRHESCFYSDIGTNAVGLMQVLVKYAVKKGYTKEMLYDPHINISYGAQYIEDRLEYYNGDVHRALAAYNMGMSKITKTNKYESAYADKVLSYLSAMDDWIVENGYSNEFSEVIELN